MSAEVAEGVLLNRPAGQSLHSLLLKASLKVPGLHRAHFTAPRALLLEPGGQGAHESSKEFPPWRVPMKPGGQAEAQVEAPCVAEKLPCAQGTHTLPCAAPEVRLAVPMAQGVHCEAPGASA